MYTGSTASCLCLALVIFCHVVVCEANRENVPTVTQENASRGTGTSQRPETTNRILPADSAHQPSNAITRRYGGSTTPISSTTISRGGTKSVIPTSIPPVTDDAQPSGDTSTSSADSGQSASQDSLSVVGNPATLMPSNVQSSSMVTGVQPVSSQPTPTPTKTLQLEPSSVVKVQPTPSQIDASQGPLSSTNWLLQPTPSTAVLLISRLQPQPTPAVLPIQLSNRPDVKPTPTVDVWIQSGESSRTILEQDSNRQTTITRRRIGYDRGSDSFDTCDESTCEQTDGEWGKRGGQSQTPESEPSPTPEVAPPTTPKAEPSPTPEQNPPQVPEAEPSPTPETSPPQNSQIPAAEPSPTPQTNPPQIPVAEPSLTPEINPPQIPNAEPSPTPETNPPQIPNAEPSPTPENYPPPAPETEPSPTAERAPPWKPNPNLEWTPKAEPEAEPTGEPNDPFGMGWDHIPWAEPEPKWDEAKDTWRFWWFVHIYTIGGLFALLALYSLVSMVRLTRKHLLSMGYFLALNFLMLLMGASRAVYMFVDAYNSLKLLHPALSYFLFSVGFPCMTSAFCLLYLALLQTTKMQAMSPKVYQTCVMVSIIVLHFGLSVATDLIIGFLGTAKILMLVCQGVFAIWGIILAFSYFFIFRRLYRSARHRMKELQRMSLSKSKLPGINPIKKKPKTRLGTAVKVTLVTAILGLLCSLLQVYAMVEVFGIFYKQPEPWPWWGFQTAFRLCEFFMCVTMSYVATQPFRFHKDGRPRDPCYGRCCYCCYRCCYRGEKIELDLPDGNAHHYSEFSCMTHSDGNLGNIHNPQGTKDIAEMIPMITMAPSDVQGSISQASIIVEDNPTTDDEILENIEVQTLTTTYDNFASSEQDTRDEEEYEEDLEAQTRSEAEGTSNTTSPQHYATDVDSPRHYVDMETSEEYLDADSSRQASNFDSPAHYADVDSPQHVVDIEIFQRDSDETPSESNSNSPSNSLIDAPLLDGNLDFEPPSPLNFRRSIDNVFTNMYTPAKSRSTFSLGVTLRDFGSGKSDSDGETSLLTLSTTDNKGGDSTGPSSETQSPSKSRSMTELGAVGGNPKYKKNPAGGAKNKPKILTSLPKFSRSSLSLGSNPSKQGYSQLDGEDSQSGESSRQDTLRRSFSDPQRRERDEMYDRGEGEGQESQALSGEPLSSPVSVQAELGHVCDAINGFAIEKDVIDL
ncbi:hypothetical protein Bbelb_104120 [Branchiostoma belcheri]|nr:hypothetical protein Bbelb_104120 [Branchiostoma belcheri]